MLEEPERAKHPSLTLVYLVSGGLQIYTTVTKYISVRVRCTLENTSHKFCVSVMSNGPCAAAIIGGRLETGHWQDCTLSVVVTVPCFSPQNTLTADDHSPEDSFTLNPEDRREYPDLQAAHRPFPKQRFRQENGHTSLQRDGPRSFLLDLPNFPDLSKADINGQNPNIQVQICVNVWFF